MRIDVEQERNLNSIAPCQPVDNGKDQQWHPGEERNCHDSPAHELEPATREMGAPKELEEGTSQDERKIARSR
jgi:hypothetical protein